MDDAQFELGVLGNGTVTLFSTKAFPKPLKRVEFYRDIRLFKIIYDDGSDDGDLIRYEVSEEATEIIRKSNHNIWLVNVENPVDPVAYDVPLVQVGF